MEIDHLIALAEALRDLALWYSTFPNIGAKDVARRAENIADSLRWLGDSDDPDRKLRAASPSSPEQEARRWLAEHGVPITINGPAADGTISVLWDVPSLEDFQGWWIPEGEGEEKDE